MQANRRATWLTIFAIALTGLAACDSTGGLSAPEEQVMAPGIDLEALADAEGASNIEVGHRLISAGEYELAIRSFNRAALERGTLDAEILSGLGTANLGLGRLGEAEKLLERAVELPDAHCSVAIAGRPIQKGRPGLPTSVIRALGIGVTLVVSLGEKDWFGGRKLVVLLRSRRDVVEQWLFLSRLQPVMVVPG